MPTPRWKEKGEEINLQADTKADSFLGKLQKSKWTGIILLAAAAGLIAIVLFLL